MTKPFLRMNLWTLALALGVFTSFVDASDATWKAGVAKANIIPEQPTWMAGYAGRDRPAEGKTTELWAKALAVQDGQGQRAVMITLDLVGIDRSTSLAIRERVAKELSIDPAAIALCTSHTHSGPVVGRNLAPMHYSIIPAEQRERIDRYTAELENKIVEISDQAMKDLEPCEVSFGNGRASFATNRRNNPEKEVPALRTAGQLAGPIDHDVPVLAVRTIADKRLKSVVFGYACHATVLGAMQWSGDYPGYAQMELEKIYPECQAMFWAGCGGDQNPLPRRTVALAEHYGRRLAAAVDTVLMTTELTPLAAKLQTRYSEIDLKLAELPTKEELQNVVETGNRYEQARAKTLLDQIESGQPLSQTYPYPIGLWTLGDPDSDDSVQWVILGGEVVIDFAIRLKTEIEGNVWVAAYANDVMAYIASRRVLAEGGYEGARSMIYYGLPTVWDPSIENAIVDEVKRLVGESVSGE